MKPCIFLMFFFAFSLVAKAEIRTSSLGNCFKTAGIGVLSEQERILHNRATITNDANTATTVRCFIDLRSDKAITKIQLDYFANSAPDVISLEPTDPMLKYYLPNCRMEFTYSPGGGEFINLNHEKSVSWGNYDRLVLNNPQMAYSGNGYLQSGILQCVSAYYTETTRLFGLRIHYAD